VTQREWIEATEPQPCFVCGTATRQIDICFEGALCSDRCEAEADHDYWESLRARPVFGDFP
jgi:hypothetical protein